MIIGNLIGVGMGRARAGVAPPSSFALPAPLQLVQDNGFLAYSERLAKTYSVGAPMPTIGQPTANALTAATEAPLQQTAGGTHYVRFDGTDGYREAVTPESSTFTAFAIGRDWTDNFAALFGRWVHDTTGSLSWAIRGDGSNALRALTSVAGTVTNVSVNPGVGVWWFMALRMNNGQRTVQFNDSIVSNQNIGGFDLSNGPLTIFNRTNADGSINFGLGDMWACGVANIALTNQQISDIAALRPIS